MSLDLKAGDSSAGPHRKVTAVGTVGEVGQLFTVYESNWKCGACGQDNYASRRRCYRCRGHKPEGENFVMDPALAALQRGETIQWKEAIDPTSYQVYYYNQSTGQTQWERPVELGPAPHATGWFGRGQSGTMAALMYSQRNDEYLKKPARKQKDFIDTSKFHTEGANEYNIWYGRYLGDQEVKGKERAPERCVLDKDAGYTRADNKAGSEAVRKKHKRFFCIHFSHGMCAKGEDCTYFHRVPTLIDDSQCEELFDCFGRQRHNKHRDDMSGVGSFMKPCRTLFVGGLLKQQYDSPKQHEEAIWKHFGEWGEVENVNVIQRLSIAFVRYRVRTSAEFAKEAMTGQALDHGEIIDIRWAHDDPNPVAQDAIDRANKDALFALMQAKGISLQDTGFNYPAEYNMPAAKRVKGADGQDLLEQDPSLAYPDTDAQYQQQASVQQEGQAQQQVFQTASGKVMTEDEYVAYCQQYYSTSSSEPVDEKSGNSDSVEGKSSSTPAADPSSSGAWEEFVDDDTGATYYYNEATGESSWGSAPPSS